MVNIVNSYRHAGGGSPPSGPFGNHPTLGTNCEGYFKLDGNTTDEIAGNDLSLISSPSSTAGHIGDCYDFDGSTQYMTYPVEFPNLVANDAFSMNVWVDIDSSPNFGELISTYIGSGINFFELRIESGSTGRPRFVYAGSSGNDASYAPSGNIIGAGWVMLTITYDGTNILCYRDGVAGVSDSVTASIGSSLADNISFMSRYNTIHVNGRMDEIGMWSKALSASEVSDLYNSGSGLTY